MKKDIIHFKYDFNKLSADDLDALFQEFDRLRCKLEPDYICLLTPFDVEFLSEGQLFEFLVHDIPYDKLSVDNLDTLLDHIKKCRR